MDNISTHEIGKLPGEPVDLDHYLVADYESTETHKQKIVIVVPSLTEPRALRIGRRTRGRPEGVVVPAIEDLTAEVATETTGIRAPFFGLRAWPIDDRRRGLERAHAYPLVATIRATGGTS